jgi:hypothetical protein
VVQPDHRLEIVRCPGVGVALHGVEWVLHRHSVASSDSDAARLGGP